MDNISSNTQLINDLFITACEGGINYWCQLDNCDFKNTTSDYTIHSNDAPSDITCQGSISAETIINGIKVLQEMNNSFSRGALNDLANEDYDAETIVMLSDVVLQLGLFRKIIFG